MIEHLDRCHQQLEWATDGPTESFLAETMLADLSECRRLCEELRFGGRGAAVSAA